LSSIYISNQKSQTSDKHTGEPKGVKVEQDWWRNHNYCQWERDWV